MGCALFNYNPYQTIDFPLITVGAIGSVASLTHYTHLKKIQNFKITEV